MWPRVAVVLGELRAHQQRRRAHPRVRVLERRSSSRAWPRSWSPPTNSDDRPRRGPAAARPVQSTRVEHLGRRLTASCGSPGSLVGDRSRRAMPSAISRSTGSASPSARRARSRSHGERLLAARRRASRTTAARRRAAARRGVAACRRTSAAPRSRCRARRCSRREPAQLVGPAQLRLGPLGQRGEVARVRVAQARELARLARASRARTRGSSRASGSARAAAADDLQQRAVDQRGEHVEHVGVHAVAGATASTRRRRAGGEHGEPPGEPPLGLARAGPSSSRRRRAACGGAAARCGCRR